MCSPKTEFVNQHLRVFLFITISMDCRKNCKELKNKNPQFYHSSLSICTLRIFPSSFFCLLKVVKMHTNTHLCLFICVCVCVYINICVHIYVYIHILYFN